LEYPAVVIAFAPFSANTQEAVVTYLPIAVSLLLAWILVRRGHITLGLLAALIIPPLLWLGAERWLATDHWCTTFRCSLGYYLDELFNDHYFFMLFVLPIGLSVLPTQLLIRRGKSRIGFIAGVLTLLVFWTAQAWVLIDTCNKCRIHEPTCCELAFFGIVYFAILALLDMLALGLIGMALNRAMQRKRQYPKESNGNSQAA